MLVGNRSHKKRQKYHRIGKIIALICLLAGVSILSYPLISQKLYEIEVRKVIADFTNRMIEHTDERSESGETKDYEELYQRIVAYNKSLYENKQKDLVDPFSYQQVDFSLKEFGFDEEMIGYLRIPIMGIELPIYLGASQENLNKGAAHLTQTSIPVGGVNTNAVIAAHRGYQKAAMFRDIEKLGIGDEITITNFWETLYYHVTEMKVIQPTDIQEILIQPGRDMVTLITCHPYRYNYQRYVVYCERVEVE